MKFLQYIFLLSLLTQHLAAMTTFASGLPNPWLVCVIMIKNEALVIKQTLQPLVDGGVQAFVVLDTGSDDNTVEMVQEFFAENNINQGHIIQQPFINFAASRNYALECAEKIFPNSGFLLMIDSEWYVEGVAELIQFCKEKYYTHHDSFYIKLYIGNSQELVHNRVFRTKSHIRFGGAVHEAAIVRSSIKAPAPIAIKYAPSNNGYEKSQQRWHRDLKLLLQEHQEQPNNTRTLFYLAQTYASLGDWQNACDCYSKRSEMNGWPEEDWCTMYRLGQCYENLNNWPMALDCYLKAYHKRGSRAEPLVSIAQHYWNIKEFQNCYIFAKHACSIAYPKDDLLFVEKIKYDYHRYNLLSCSAWYVQDYENGRMATLTALEQWPDAWHLNFNLNLYNQALGLQA